MAVTDITFNGTSLQDQYTKIGELDHESMDQRELQYERLGTRDGAKLVDDGMAPKTIKFGGTIKSSDGTKETLETQIDALKANLHPTEKTLLIDYISGTRKYIGTFRITKIQRKFYQISYADIQLEFVASNPPVGIGGSSTTIDYAAVTQAGGTWDDVAAFDGTYFPFPRFKYTINSETGMTSIILRNTDTGEEMTITPDAGFTAGDIVIVNTDDLTVTVNGVASDYSGVFPSFELGNNNIQHVFDGTAYNVSLSILYFKRYL